MSRGGLTEESGSGLEQHIPGKAEEPAGTRIVGRGCVEGIFEGVDLIACGRLASNQLVHACSGNPVPFSKVPGQGLQTGNFIEQATLEQGDLEAVLSTVRGACVGVLDPEPGSRRTALSKTLPSNEPEAKNHERSMETSRPRVMEDSNDQHRA